MLPAIINLVTPPGTNTVSPPEVFANVITGPIPIGSFSQPKINTDKKIITVIPEINNLLMLICF